MSNDPDRMTKAAGITTVDFEKEVVTITIPFSSIRTYVKRDLMIAIAHNRQTLSYAAFGEQNTDLIRQVEEYDIAKQKKST